MLRCGMYLRISREDGGRESDSIQNQRRLITQFLERQPEMELAGEWVDDGWSGSRFDRPGFRQMMQAAARGEIGCILVKDLSRLGREYIQTGYYLREILPELGIRLIAIADHYDSSHMEWMEQSLLVPVLNLMNDAYCRDISGKVRWQQKAKREAGEYIGAFAVYGYRKSEENIHRLVVDEGVRDVIVAIYLLRLSGMAAENIARSLNRMKIPPPGKYKRMQGSRYISGFDTEGRAEIWSALSVRRILQNEMYTGVLMQGKDRKISYKLPLRQSLPKREWVRTEKGVPAVIPAWIYQRVCSLGEMRLRCRKGRVFCGLWDGIWKDKPDGEFRWLWECLFCILLSEGKCLHYGIDLPDAASYEEGMRKCIEDAPYIMRLLVVIMCRKIEYEKEKRIIRMYLY